MFVVFWRTGAPYGFEKDARDLAALPCPAGYIAQGWLTMNQDLEELNKHNEELLRLNKELHKKLQAVLRTKRRMKRA